MPGKGVIGLLWSSLNVWRPSKFSFRDFLSVTYTHLGLWYHKAQIRAWQRGHRASNLKVWRLSNYFYLEVFLSVAYTRRTMDDLIEEILAELPEPVPPQGAPLVNPGKAIGDLCRSLASQGLSLFVAAGDVNDRESITEGFPSYAVVWQELQVCLMDLVWYHHVKFRPWYVSWSRQIDLPDGSLLEPVLGLLLSHLCCRRQLFNGCEPLPVTSGTVVNGSQLLSGFIEVLQQPDKPPTCGSDLSGLCGADRAQKYFVRAETRARRIHRRVMDEIRYHSLWAKKTHVCGSVSPQFSFWPVFSNRPRI